MAMFSLLLFVLRGVVRIYAFHRPHFHHGPQGRLGVGSVNLRMILYDGQNVLEGFPFRNADIRGVSSFFKNHDQGRVAGDPVVSWAVHVKVEIVSHDVQVLNDSAWNGNGFLQHLIKRFVDLPAQSAGFGKR